MAKIMIVDDSALIQAMLETCLTPLGHSLVKVTDGRNVVPALNEHKPDLLILDYQMPGTSGVEVYGRVRREAAGARVPVIFLSAAETYELADVIPKTPLVRIFQKPVNLVDLQRVVDEMLAPSKPAPPPGPRPEF